MSVRLLVGALGVHELRYVLAYNGEAEAALAHHWHGYLTLVTPLLGVLLALALGHLLVRTAASRRGKSWVARLGATWLLAALALLGLYVARDVLEGTLAPGHQAWTGVFGAGGWVAVMLAVTFGALLALSLGVARVVAASTVAYRSRWRPAWSLFADLRLACVPRRPRASALAEHLAGRAPPAMSLTD